MESTITYEHATYDLYGCTHSLLTDDAAGIRCLRRICLHAGLTVLEEFRYRFPTGGYSCNLILSESHASLHTWPETGYCALDIFVCSGNLSKAEEALMIEFKPRKFDRRLFNRGPRRDGAAPTWIQSSGSPLYHEAYRVSRVLHESTSRYQHIQVADHQQFGRLLLLNGDIQLATSDEAIYHEALVHPAMLAHTAPRSVAILGGGDGGCLREVLKYDGLERIFLVEIDQEVWNVSRQYLTEVCPQAPVKEVELVFKDAAAWIGTELCDIMVVDLTSPDALSTPAYNRLLEGASRCIKPGGFLSMHSGWWSRPDAPSMTEELARRFDHALLNNIWIDSFNCYWAFVLAWNHNVTPASVAQSVSASPSPELRHFSPSAYARDAWSRCI